MKKKIDKKYGRVFYFGEIDELKDYLKFLSVRLPFDKEQIREASNNLEKISSTDYLNNNIHTSFEKLYFNKEFILYSSRNDFYIPFLLKNCEYAEKYLILKKRKTNPDYKIEVEKK